MNNTFVNLSCIVHFGLQFFTQNFTAEGMNNYVLCSKMLLNGYHISCVHKKQNVNH